MRALGELDPRLVGSVRLLAGLGADEMGPVLVGTTPDGRLVAVKVVSAPLVADPGFPQRFAREVAGLRQVVGPCNAPVVDAGPADATPWVAADFLPGVSLGEMVGRGVLLGEDAILRLAAGLASALTEIHRAGLVHRDLTPAHVRLTEDSVRLLDFGVARAVDHDVSLVVGDPEFMSPEQAGRQALTPASDVFSLGAVLHLAATGRSAFAGETRTESLALVSRAQPELPGSLPSRIRQLLGACLVGDPLARPTLDQLRAMIGPVPLDAHPWPPLVRAMITEQYAEVARLLDNVAAPAGVDAPTTLLAPVVVPAAPPPKKTSRRRAEPEDERWKPDMWAVVSGGAVVVTVVFAIVMFNVLTPDRPLRASGQETGAATTSASVAPTTSTTSTTTTTTTTTATQRPEAGPFTGLAGKCVDIAGANAANGTPVQLHECNGTDAQQWVFAQDGTVRGLGKCLDVVGGDTSDGARVQIHDCNGTGAQQWVPTTEGWIINVASNKCLDVPAGNTADGTQLAIWTCHGDVNQRWNPPA
ncbi:ricin-type beta-trefoil lectin domain protein [Actinophytocola glycyrrhizae]|uniref:non-specific serine/threonine protein kinase n=1 Tax=Actinophytocola glycyrrhizae TaxID=2044873 RepID=A0ABV9S8D7_9PSEU